MRINPWVHLSFKNCVCLKQAKTCLLLKTLSDTSQSRNLRNTTASTIGTFFCCLFISSRQLSGNQTIKCSFPLPDIVRTGLWVSVRLCVHYKCKPVGKHTETDNSVKINIKSSKGERDSNGRNKTKPIRSVFEHSVRSQWRTWSETHQETQQAVKHLYIHATMIYLADSTRLQWWLQPPETTWAVCIITVRSVWTSSSPNRTNQQTNKHKKKQLDWTAAHRLIRYWTFLFLERYRLLLCLYRCRKLMKSPEEEKKSQSLFGSQTHSVTFLSECLSSHPSASLPLLCSKRCYKCPISHIWQDNRNQTQSD